MYFVPLCCCSEGPFEWNPSSCSPAAPLCPMHQIPTVLDEGRCQQVHSASSAALRRGMWAMLVAPFASASSHTVLRGRRHSAWSSPIGRCHGALYSPWPFCAPLWLPVALAGSPADNPTGLQLQMCLGAAHWLRRQLTASSDPRSRCLQIMPTRRPPTNSQCCSNLALCSLLCSPPIHSEPPSASIPSKQATGWQSSAVRYTVQCSAVQSSAVPTSFF